MSSASRNALDACLADLARVVDDLRWAHATGFGKAGRGLDAERGAALPPRDDEDDEDFVKAPTYQLDIGDHDCRVAYQRTASRLAKVEVYLARSCTLAGLVAQPILVTPTSHSSLARVLTAGSGIRWRLIALREVDVSDGQARKINRHVSQARRLLDVSVRNLGKALSKGKATEATAEAACVVCRIRPARDRRKDCETCHAWQRRNGFERPTTLDEAVAEDARAAKRRREARDEGWGAA